MPFAAGTGLLCLDAIHLPAQNTFLLSTGGTAFNILAHLHTKGWHTRFMGYIGNDRPAAYILNDLKQHQIPTRGILQSEGISTPVYVQAHAEDGHTFLRECPTCSTPFPRVTPLPLAFIEEQIAQQSEPMDIVILERAHPSAIRLAESARQQGALVYVELNRFDPDHEDAELLLSLANVFKCSMERLHYFEALPSRKNVPVEIITQGKNGVRYRLENTWYEQPGMNIENLVDAAGAGDAFSASLLESLVMHSRNHSPEAWEERIQNAQAYTAATCRSIGARGAISISHAKQFGDDFCVACARVST